MSWINTTVGELIDVKHGFAFKSEYFSDFGEYVVLTPGNCYNEGGFKSKGEKEKWYVGDIPESYLLNEGDLLLVMTDLVNTAPVLGGSFLIPENNKYLHNQRLGLVQIKEPSKTNKRFLYYLFNTHDYRGQVRGSASGSTVRHTAPERIKSCKVRIPCEYDDQKRIADTLAAYDDLIENNKRRIELLEESARQLYKEWFVRFRFPGHEHVKIIDSVPEGWEKTTLGSVAVTNVLSHKSKGLPERLNYVDISSVSNGRIEIKNTMPSEDAPGRARRIARHGDVIWSNVRPNLRAYALVLHPAENDVFSTGFTVITATQVPYSFLYHFVTSDNFVNHLVNHTTGASYPAVRPPDFEKAELIFPTQGLLELFHETVESNYELISILEAQNKQLLKARDILLPKLMSGEIAA